MTMPESGPNIDPNILQNKLSLALSRKRKLVSSWLPAPTIQESAAIKSAEQQASEEAQIWKPKPPTVGLGHSASDTPDLRQDILLRQRLLGKASKIARHYHLEKRQHDISNIATTADDRSSDDEEEASKGFKSGTKSRKLQQNQNTRENLKSETPGVDIDTVEMDAGKDDAGFVPVLLQGLKTSRFARKAKDSPRELQDSSQFGNRSEAGINDGPRIPQDGTTKEGVEAEAVPTTGIFATGHPPTSRATKKKKKKRKMAAS